MEILEPTEKTLLEKTIRFFEDDDWDEVTSVTEITQMSRDASILHSDEDDVTQVSGKFSKISIQNPFVKGMIRALPVILGYLPLAFAYGVMAGKANMSFFATVLMSVVVYAGASQYVAISLLVSGQAMAAIVFTTFIINLRHILLSTAIAPQLKNFRPLQRILFALQLTDEAYVMHVQHYSDEQLDSKESFGTNVAAHLAWILGSILGFSFGTMVEDVGVFGFDYALPAMFLALIVFQVKDRKGLAVSFFSIFLMLVFKGIGLEQSAIILVTLIGASAGLVMELWKTEPLSY